MTRIKVVLSESIPNPCNPAIRGSFSLVAAGRAVGLGRATARWKPAGRTHPAREINRLEDLRYAKRSNIAISVPATTNPGATRQPRCPRRAAAWQAVHPSGWGWFPLFPAVQQRGARARLRMAACRPASAPITCIIACSWSNCPIPPAFALPAFC